uniref:Uncharacterized protein n=1 Tax=Nymphaea colorata TaxID=210225 RepID=A0A5K0Y6J1_9MAGN|nr:unnamed protein product [Nymphaea colorata]
MEHLTTHLHKPRTTRSPQNERGDGGIVPFEPFFHVFPGGLEKAAINRISLIFPSRKRKEEREILFPRDLAIRRMLGINNSLLGLRPPQSLRPPPDQCNGMCLFIHLQPLQSLAETLGEQEQGKVELAQPPEISLHALSGHEVPQLMSVEGRL